MNMSEEIAKELIKNLPNIFLSLGTCTAAIIAAIFAGKANSNSRRNTDKLVQVEKLVNGSTDKMVQAVSDSVPKDVVHQLINKTKQE